MTREEIIKFLRKRKEATVKEIAEGIKLSNSATAGCISRMRKWKIVYVIRIGKGGRNQMTNVYALNKIPKAKI